MGEKGTHKKNKCFQEEKTVLNASHGNDPYLADGDISKVMCGRQEAMIDLGTREGFF